MVYDYEVDGTDYPNPEDVTEIAAIDEKVAPELMLKEALDAGFKPRVSIAVHELVAELDEVTRRVESCERMAVQEGAFYQLCSDTRNLIHMVNMLHHALVDLQDDE
tara:strand:+ start:450 stop:767 length:318 start_codon:yes stop_codon:yes gene_type:complete